MCIQVFLCIIGERQTEHASRIAEAIHYGTIRTKKRLLILGFAGGMLNHLQYTAKASEAEALESSEAEALESSEAEDDTTEKENGVLYFNVGNSIYSFNPAVNASPAKIYQYDDAEKRIVTGLLVSGNTMTVEIYNPTTYKIEDKLTLPVFTLSASESSITADYTTPPVLTANPLATGFTWSKQLTDGSWETISGAVDSSYTIETGLPAGSYRYRVQATLNGTSVSAEIVITVTEKNNDGDDNNGGNDGYDGNNNAGGNSNASTPGAPTQSADKTKSPATGDTLPVMLYTLLAIASGSIMLKIYSRKKRPTHI